jgi:TetR/AcrR family transcriptional regulator
MGIAERKEREKEHRKEDIIDAAQKVFFEKGLLTATMDEIAVTAELAKGTLYLYYKSKEDLYLAVMMRGLKILYEMFEKVIDSPKPTTEKLMELGEAYTAYYEQNKNYFRMLHFFQTPQFHRQVTEEMKQACSINNQKLWSLVIGIFKKGIEEKTIREDLNPTDVAIIIWSTATTLLMRIDSEYDLWKERMHIDLNQTLRLSYSLLLDSIQTEKGKLELKSINK